MDATRLSNADISAEERLCRLLRVEMEQSGTDPSRWLEALADAIEREAWLSVSLASFPEFVTSDKGLASTPDAVRTLVSLPHHHERIDDKTATRMDWLRAQVRDLLNDPLAKPGKIGRGRNRVCNTNSSESTDSSYVISRLKRDDPPLARRVVSGEISAHAAAVQSGIRKARRSVPADPVAHGTWIASHYSREQIDELVSALLTAVREREVG